MPEKDTYRRFEIHSNSDEAGIEHVFWYRLRTFSGARLRTGDPRLLRSVFYLFREIRLRFSETRCLRVPLLLLHLPTTLQAL